MQVTSIILGDSAFPLIPWLMKPYTNAASTPRQHFLNYRLDGKDGNRRGIWPAKEQVSHTIEEM